ncbi:MAG: hypothetical protein CM15mP8_0110 [Methanobacteriota archaeon]|nr:MAG: hypothetical protein CM15mP8_0110 [Euryarchaeota archaeon]
MGGHSYPLMGDPGVAKSQFAGLYVKDITRGQKFRTILHLQPGLPPQQSRILPLRPMDFWGPGIGLGRFGVSSSRVLKNE